MTPSPTGSRFPAANDPLGKSGFGKAKVQGMDYEHPRPESHLH